MDPDDNEAQPLGVTDVDEVFMENFPKVQQPPSFEWNGPRLGRYLAQYNVAIGKLEDAVKKKEVLGIVNVKR